MNWSEFRTSYANKHGPTTMSKLSVEYEKYKKSSKASPKKIIKASPKKPIRASPKKVSAILDPRIKSGRTIKKMSIHDIENLAKDKKFLIVVLYADWCGHCKELKQKLGSKMRNTDKIIFVEANDMDDNLKDYFPHILYYENGKKQSDLNVDNVYGYLSV